MKPPPDTLTVWVGYVDGKPDSWRDDHGERNIAVYPTRRKARRAYADVRKATTMIEQTPKDQG